MTAVFKSYAEALNAFKADCEELIKAFQEKLSDLFTDFVLTWKALGFHLIYDKYSKNYQAYDQCFKEDCLQIAKIIMLNDNFVGGMYLLYSLYYMQEDPKGLVRIEFHEFHKLMKLLQEERQSLIETCQPGFIFTKLLRNDAFSFVSFSRHYTVDGLNRARVIFGGYQNQLQDLQITPAKEWFDKFLKRVDSVDNITNFEKRYFKKKQKIESDFPEMNLKFDLEPLDFITGLDLVLNTAASMEMPAEDIGYKRKLLKNRKRKIRHRYEKPADPDTESTEESSIKVVKKKNNRRYLKKVFKSKHASHLEEISEDEDVDGQAELSDSDSDEPILSLPDIS